MDLALHFPSPSFGYSLSRTAVNGDRRIRPQEKAFSSSSKVRFKKGYICCKKLSDEQTSNPSKSKQEEMISLLKRIQLSISKDESQGATKKKNVNGRTPENEPSLSKAILDVLEKPRKKTEGDTSVKKELSKLARPESIKPSASGHRELKEVAKTRGIKGYSKLKKSELQILLTSS